MKLKKSFAHSNGQMSQTKVYKGQKPEGRQLIVQHITFLCHCISNKIIIIVIYMKFSFSNSVQLAHRHDKDDIYSAQTTIVHKARLTLYESVSLG